jgi:hypothetical protein
MVFPLYRCRQFNTAFNFRSLVLSGTGIGFIFSFLIESLEVLRKSLLVLNGMILKNELVFEEIFFQ